MFKIGLQMGVTFLGDLLVLASFLGSCFQDGSWRPQKLQNQGKNAKNMKKMRHFFEASGLQLWPGRPSSRPQSQVQQVDFTAELQTRTNPWPQSLQCWICSGLQIRREVHLLRLVFGGAAMTRRMASSIKVPRIYQELVHYVHIILNGTTLVFFF